MHICAFCSSCLQLPLRVHRQPKLEELEISLTFRHSSGLFCGLDSAKKKRKPFRASYSTVLVNTIKHWHVKDRSPGRHTPTGEESAGHVPMPTAHHPVTRYGAESLDTSTLLYSAIDSENDLEDGYLESSFTKHVSDRSGLNFGQDGHPSCS